MISNFFTKDFPVKKIMWKKFLKRFLWKIEAEGKIFKGFLEGISFKISKKPKLVLHVLYFIGDFFYKTRASLARAAFYRVFLL